jgi:antitoxin (DNA-binding transcriptional repressor) of toxin-antitoxin stability system
MEALQFNHPYIKVRTLEMQTPSVAGTRKFSVFESVRSCHLNAPSCGAPDIGYNSHMDKATVSKLKDNLSAYLRKVRAGHPVVIYDRDVPIARLERIESSGSGSDRLALLRAQGLTRPPSRPLSTAQLRTALAASLPRHAQLSDALRSERDEGR